MRLCAHSGWGAPHAGRAAGGNLGKAVRIHAREYDLVLMPDINTRAAQSGGNTQWYYFAVSNMEVRPRP